MLGRVIADQIIRKATSGQTKPALMLREAARTRGDAARATFGRGLAMGDYGAVRTRAPEERRRRVCPPDERRDSSTSGNIPA